jgi:hypothetical protein
MCIYIYIIVYIIIYLYIYHNMYVLYTLIQFWSHIHGRNDLAGATGIQPIHSASQLHAYGRYHLWALQCVPRWKMPIWKFGQWSKRIWSATTTRHEKSGPGLQWRWDHKVGPWRLESPTNVVHGVRWVKEDPFRQSKFDFIDIYRILYYSINDRLYFNILYYMILYNRLDMLDHSAHQLNSGRDNSTADRIDAVDRCSVFWGAMMVAATQATW